MLNPIIQLGRSGSLGYPKRLTFLLPVMPNVEDRLLDIEFSKNDFFDMYQQIQDMILKWDMDQFPATGNQEFCRYCNVRNYCNQF